MVAIINIMSKSYITRLQMPKSTAFLSKVTQLMAEKRKTVHAHKGQEPRAFSLTPETGKKIGNPIPVQWTNSLRFIDL